MRLRPALVVPPVATLIALAACAGGPRPAPAPAPRAGPASPPAAAPAPAPAATPTPSAATARFAYASGPASYDVRTDATIEMTGGPAAERGRETVQTTARVTYEMASTARAVTLTGSVDGLAVQASSRVMGGAAVPNGPVLFRATVDARGARVDLNVPPLGCLSPAGAAQVASLAAARETLARVPATLAVGTRWRDSLSAPTCRGPLGAVATTIERYEVTAIDGPRVTVRRESQTVTRGQGIAGGRSITLAGSGDGTTTLQLDATTGRLTAADGDTRATITVTLPDGPRTFAQTTKIEVRPRR